MMLSPHTVPPWVPRAMRRPPPRAQARAIDWRDASQAGPSGGEGHGCYHPAYGCIRYVAGAGPAYPGALYRRVGSGAWASMGITGPGGHRYGQLTYDAGAHRLIYCSGYKLPGFTVSADTYALADGGAAWALLDDATCGAGEGMPVVWDPVGKRLLQHVPGAPSRTLALASGGTAWVDLGISTPPLPAHRVFEYDSIRGVWVLWGGCGADALTWEFDGTAWRSITVAGPPLRAYVNAVFDAGRGQIIVYGGYTAAGNLDDTWCWNGVAWRQQTTVHSPGARFGHTTWYDPTRETVVIEGGTDVGDYADTWELRWRNT